MATVISPGTYTVSIFPAAGARYIVGGSVYVWTGSYFVDVSGRRVDPGVYFVAATAPPNTLVPQVLGARPIPAWCPRSVNFANSLISSVDIEQVRAVRVGLFAEVQKSYRIPLVDDEGVPYLGPELPPFPILRWAEDLGAATDHVGSYDINNLDWWDEFDGLRATPYSTSAPLEWHLERVLDPIPHWEFVMDSHFFGLSRKTFLIDFIGQGSGDHSSDDVEVGTGGVAGHYKVELTYGPQLQDFMATSLASRLNERRLVRGSFAVNASTQSTTYLTSTQLSGGTTLFTTIPAIRVTAHDILGSNVAASGDTAWHAETYGLGFTSTDVNWVDTTGQTRRFRTSVRRDSVSGKVAVVIDNRSTSLRTFFFHAVGVG